MQKSLKGYNSKLRSSSEILNSKNPYSEASKVNLTPKLEKYKLEQLQMVFF
jgi:hypothetical protein